MFQMKNVSDDKDLEVRKLKDDATNHRVKRSSHTKKKSKKSPSEILNYKQALRSRLTVKQGFFPQAIKTNVMARNDRSIHSPKISANEINQRLKNCNVLNKILHEEKSSNETFLETPFRNEHQESFYIADHQSRMSVTISPSSQKSITLSDTVKNHDLNVIIENPSPLSPISLSEMERARMPSADFTYYAPQQAQKILLYQEVCQIVNKTMIMEKVSHFGNFPDMVQKIRNKLWEVRSSRDENFNPDVCSAIRRNAASTVDPFSDDDDELCPDRSPPNFHSPMQDSSEAKTPEGVEMDEIVTSPRLEFKLPLGPNAKKDCDRIDSEAAVDTRMGSEDETDEPTTNAYWPRKNDKFKRKYQNSIFSSALIPTCKLDQNLTMNPIEFLENLSKTDNEDFHPSNNEFDVRQPTFADNAAISDPSSKFDNYKSPRRRSLNKWLGGTDVEEPFQNDNMRPIFGEYRPGDHRTNRNVNISMKRPFDCSNHKESGASRLMKLADKNQEIPTNLDYVFPSLDSDTPEMKYYPCRLH